VRSVPWLQLGPFVLQGLHSPAELREWAGRAGSMDGMRQYLHDQLKEGNLEAMETLLAQQPRWLPALVPLLEDEDTDLKVRIGVDALLESLAGGVDLSPLIPELERLSRHERSSLRADATHYLSLTGSPEAVPFIQARLQDDDDEVRTIAKEAMQEIEAG
ncbi:MAG TPA: HEAT repeat domain-containing protein, partial [Chromatiales bacterium]|nr:HEAT repeat domain-containing protein [Chromatiales bacterium]